MRQGRRPESGGVIVRRYMAIGTATWHSSTLEGKGLPGALFSLSLSARTRVGLPSAPDAPHGGVVLVDEGVAVVRRGTCACVCSSNGSRNKRSSFHI